MSTTSAMPRDGCIVTAAPFTELVEKHVTRWKVEHPGWDRERNEIGYYNGLIEGAPIQALVWLSATASGIADPTGKWMPRLVVPKGLLERLLNHRRQVLELRAADAIALALDAPYVSAGIEIFPNPDASEESRHEGGWHDDTPSAACDICRRIARAGLGRLAIAI